jgi:uncharacterized protein (DUF697 family)
MAEQVQTPTDEPLRVWQPSRSPEHRLGVTDANQSIVAEQAGPNGVLGVLLAFVKRPFVKLVVGLGVFILAAIVYDNTLNFGSWTERAEPRKATKHPGLAPVQKTPD